MSQTTDRRAAADGRDTRWADHRQARRARLLEAAVAMIDRDGVAVSVPAIAAEAEIPRSVVYKLFKDREDLDDQIRDRIIDDVNRALSPVFARRGTPRELVRTGASSYVGWVTAHPNLHRFLGAGSATKPTHGSRVMLGGKEAFAERLRRLIDDTGPAALGRSLPRGSSHNIAFAIVGLVDNTVNHWVTAGSARSSKKDLVDFLTNAVCSVIETAAAAAGGAFDTDGPLGG